MREGDGALEPTVPAAVRTHYASGSISQADANAVREGLKAELESAKTKLESAQTELHCILAHLIRKIGFRRAFLKIFITQFFGKEQIKTRFHSRVENFVIVAAAIVPVYRDIKNKRLVSAPGRFAKTLLSFLFPKKAFDSVFSQVIIDMREEHAEALAIGAEWKARWIVVRDHLNLILTVLEYLATAVIRRALSLLNGVS